MKAFNIQNNSIIEVFRAEELSDTVFPITDEQEENIHKTLSNGGSVYVKDGELRYSGPAIQDHYWNNTLEQWIFSQELKDKRISEERKTIWEKIKERRSLAQSSGVLIKSINKWVHTDAEAQRNYLFLKLVIDNPQFDPPYWKAMDGSYFKMTPEIFQEIVLRAYKKAQQDFATGDLHYNEMMKLEEPATYNYDRWWSEGYKESTSRGD